MDNLNIDKYIRLFAKFMDNAWDIVRPMLVERHYTTDEDALYDWLQANWELLVERKVLSISEYLEPYGAGADFNSPSSRITMPEALPSFSIKIDQVDKENVYDLLNEEYCEIYNAEFIELVGFKQGFYIQEPKFDCVLIRDHMNIERVVNINKIRFLLCKLAC